MTLTEHERRILSYLDQRGITRRDRLVLDLASPDSKIGRHRDEERRLSGGSSSNGEAMIAANWCKRLVAAALVRCVATRDGFHLGYEVTHSGRRTVRDAL